MSKRMLIFFLATLMLSACVPTTPPPPPSDSATPSPQAETTVPANWVSYTSPRHGYSFAYAPDWTFLPFDENNPEVVGGTHTLMNYDPNQAERYLDHGLIDWEAFRGQEPALKLDISAQPLAEETPEEAKSRIISSEATAVPNAVLQIGNLETSVYTSTVVGGPFNGITSYVAVSGNNLITVHQYLANTSPEEFVTTESYQTLKTILASFRF